MSTEGICDHRYVDDYNNRKIAIIMLMPILTWVIAIKNNYIDNYDDWTIMIITDNRNKNNGSNQNDYDNSAYIRNGNSKSYLKLATTETTTTIINPLHAAH